MMKVIGGVLGRSPFGPLQEHMLKVCDCLNVLKPLIKEFIEGNHSKVKSYSNRISKLEHEADIIKEVIRKSLSKSIFVSIERADILACLKEQDRIADSCEDVAKLMEMRQTEVPSTLKEELLKLVDKVIGAVDAMKGATAQLKSLEESSYDKKRLNEILKSIDLAARREWEADVIQLNFAKKLFQMEKQIDPVSVFFLMNIGKQVGLIANHAENTGDVLRRIIVRR